MWSLGIRRAAGALTHWAVSPLSCAGFYVTHMRTGGHHLTTTCQPLYEQFMLFHLILRKLGDIDYKHGNNYDETLFCTLSYLGLSVQAWGVHIIKPIF